eukprot:Hpha_TRINITY_DN15391_c5_g1::TRINITY_DN15391_c5_g1_i1::g.90877::m.90877
MAGGALQTPSSPPQTPPHSAAEVAALESLERGQSQSSAPRAARPAGEDRAWSTVVVHDSESAKFATWAADTLVGGVPALAGAQSRLRVVAAADGDFTAAASSQVSPDLGGTLVVAVFYDAKDDQSRREFDRLKVWAQSTGSLVQAINGKKGKHVFWTRPEEQDLSVVVDQLVQAVRGKILGASSGPRRHEDPSARSVGRTCSTMSGGTDVSDADRLHYCLQGPEETDAVIAQLTLRLREGQGETVVKLGVDDSGSAVGLDEKTYAGSLDSLRELADRLRCGVSVVCEKVLREGRRCAEVMLRQDTGESYIDMRVAVCGNVDSGKSTLVGVLTRGQWDDGRGAVRAKVFNHRHELESGRTSSVSEQYLGFDARGNTVNYLKCGAQERQHKISNRELCDRSAKVFTVYDLAGHERYLKTTVLGMTGSAPDYACLVISANNGIQRMTKEHLGLCLALRIPFFVVITRVDATPSNVLQGTLDSVTKMLKLPSVRKLPYFVKKAEDVVICAKNVKADRVAPIFQVSNVDGTGIENLLQFLNLIPVRRDWLRLAQMPKEMVIDSTFYVSGVGTVVGGLVTQGQFKTGDSVLLGPNGHGHFRQVQIKSIQVKGVDATHVEAGSDAAFALKKERRSAIRKGNVLLDPKIQPLPHSSWEFEADVVVLYHSTTIKSNYEPVIHCSTVRQSAKITLVDTDILRTGDKARVRFRFLHRPEYIRIGTKLVFREGRTKGLGTVTAAFDDTATIGPKIVKGRMMKERTDGPPAAADAAATKSPPR